MTSLAELGEISKATGKAPEQIEGYKTGRLSGALNPSSQGYFAEDPKAKRRRALRSTYGLAGGVAGLGAVAAATKGKGIRIPKEGSVLRRAMNTEVPLKDYNRKYLPAMAGGIAAGQLIAQRQNIKSGDVRWHSKKTGERQDYGFWKPKKWKEPE